MDSVQSILFNEMPVIHNIQYGILINKELRDTQLLKAFDWGSKFLLPRLLPRVDTCIVPCQLVYGLSMI